MKQTAAVSFAASKECPFRFSEPLRKSCLGLPLPSAATADETLSAFLRDACLPVTPKTSSPAELVREMESAAAIDSVRAALAEQEIHHWD
ncbi:MAG: hypothetical protein U0744_08850 [Gemmataceae bacterium]